MARTALHSACPQCGAPILFGGAHSIVSVCEHCHSAIARLGVEVTRLGQLPDLVAIDTRLSVGDLGSWQGQSFQILGRVQLNQGAATWNEWYVAWQDGSFGWLAEAQGRVVLSRRADVAQSVPPWAAVRPGERLTLGDLGQVVVQEVGDARVVSAQGELPFQPQLHSTYRFVDASTPGAGFITLDYGTRGDDAEIFVGRELSYADVQLPGESAARAYAEPKASGRALTCPGCAGPVPIKLANSASIVCPACHRLCNREGDGLALVGALQQRHQPQLPLGARGTLFGHKLEVIGWLRRAVTVSNTEYTWDEYLLHGEVGYRWLSEADGHWTFIEPIPPSQVAVDAGRKAAYHGRTYRHFQRSTQARYVEIQGEFYWAMQLDERVDLDDYVAPPFQLSREETDKELTWSHGRYLEADLLWKSFEQSGQPPAQRGIAPCQPNPYRERVARTTYGVALGSALLLLATIVLMMALPGRVYISLDLPIAAEPTTTLSEPFDVGGSAHALEFRAHGSIAGTNDCMGLDIALIDDATGKTTEVELELSRYAGYSDGESWVEETSQDSKRVGGIAPGRYVLRVETQPSPNCGRPVTAHVEVKHGVFLWLPFWLCLLGLYAYPSWLWLGRALFEGRRWSQSDYASSSSSSSSDDSDDSDDSDNDD